MISARASDTWTTFGMCLHRGERTSEFLKLVHTREAIAVARKARGGDGDADADGDGHGAEAADRGVDADGALEVGNHGPG